MLLLLMFHPDSMPLLSAPIQNFILIMSVFFSYFYHLSIPKQYVLVFWFNKFTNGKGNKIATDQMSSPKDTTRSIQYVDAALGRKGWEGAWAKERNSEFTTFKSEMAKKTLQYLQEKKNQWLNCLKFGETGA